MINLTQDDRPGNKDDFPAPHPLSDVRAWSFSALKVFEECPYRTYITRVKGIREPSSKAGDRGSAIHDLAEQYVDGTIEKMPSEIKKFENEFLELREQYTQGVVELEGEWGFTSSWQPTAWMGKDVWARIKLDALVHDSPTSARVIDYKTGKKFGNEISHGQQGLLYAIATFFKYPDLQFVQTEFWYLDQKRESNPTTKSYTRAEAMLFAPGWHMRGVKMTTETNFEPTPSSHSCRWCPHKTAEEGEQPQCKWGVL
jgi:hypothetical protein